MQPKSESFEVNGELIEIQELGPVSNLDEALAAFQKAIHDCPECRAARARGEEPIVVVPERRKANAVFRRRPRWRTLKRSAARGRP